MIYIFRKDSTQSGSALAEELLAIRLRDISRVANPTKDDLLVCWGNSAPPGWPGRVLNGGPHPSKIEAVGRLQLAGVPTINITTTRPTSKRPEFNLQAGLLDEQAGQRLKAELEAWLSAPVQPAEGWIPRSAVHEDGSDLIASPIRPDFWVQRETFQNEFRVHSFRGKSIRAGVKVPRRDDEWVKLGQNPHPWIKAWRTGWHVGGNSGVTDQMRSVAHAAVSALGLDFGAVDIGQRSDGSFIVLEVNREPGIDTGVIEAYAGAIAAL